MDKKSDNKLTMLVTVIAVMEQFQPLWSQTAGLREATASLHAYRFGIETGAIQQSLPLKALTKKRREQRKVLIDFVLGAGSALIQYARQTNDTALFADATVDLSTLSFGRELETVTEAARVLDLAKRHPAAFTPMEEGAPTLLDELASAEKTYREAVDGRRGLIIERSNGTRGIASNTMGAGEQLRNLDRLMRPLRRKSPEFFAAYKQARRLKANRTPRVSVSGIPAAEASQQKVA